MPIPTYAETITQETLAPSISIISGGNIFNISPEDEGNEMSIEEMNAQLKKSSGEEIEFISHEPLLDLPFEEYKKTL